MTDNNRTKMIHVYAPVGLDCRVEVARECIRTYANGDTVPVPAGARTVRRTFAGIATLSLPGAPVSISTYADLAKLLSAIGDAWAVEDELAAQVEADRVAASEEANKARMAASLAALQQHRAARSAMVAEAAKKTAEAAANSIAQRAP